MVYRKIRVSFLKKMVLCLFLAGCTSERIAEPVDVARNNQGVLSAGHAASYLLLPGARTYAILTSPLVAWRFVAEVKLYKDTFELGRLLDEDSRRTGAKTFKMVSENFVVEDLNEAMPRLSWWGDILRGFGDSIDIPLIQNVHAVVVRKLTKATVSSEETDCPVLIFGDSESLYTITTTSQGIRTVERVQVSSGVRNLNQAEALANGTCLTPEFYRSGSLRSFERAGRVGGSNGRPRLIWSSLETIAGY